MCPYSPRAVSPLAYLTKTLVHTVLAAVLVVLTAPAARATFELKGVRLPTGPAPRWGAGLPAGPYGQVDLQTGRVVTAIPVVGLGGKGPAVSFTLYHHMLSPWSKPGSIFGFMGDMNLDGAVDDNDIVPFVDAVLDPDPDPIPLEMADFDTNLAADEEDLDGLISLLVAQETGPVWTHTYSTFVEKVRMVVLFVHYGDGTR